VRVALAMLLLTSTAHANSDDIITRPLVLAPGQVTAALTLEYSLTTRSVGTPVSVAPDAWVGVTDRLTLGVIHSSPSVDRIDARSSLCLRGTELTCDHAYRGSGIDVRYRLRDDIVPRARVLLRDIDPLKPALTLGALMRWTHGRFSLRSDPYLRFGLANRGEGNRAAFVVPVWIGFQPTCRWLLELHTGADGDLAVIRDGWHMPFSAVVTARATSALDIVVEAGFSQLYGPQIDIRQRAVMITAAYSR
jgi:hypothetical protein